MTTYNSINKNTTSYSTVSKLSSGSSILREVSSILLRESGGKLFRELPTSYNTSYSSVNKNSTSFSNITKN